MQPLNISVVTTCKGRLCHLQQTLPLLVAQAPAEIIVVDYGCPDNAGDWIDKNYPSVNVIRVTDDQGFCPARARNLGAMAVSFDWILFIDADIHVSANLFEWMNSNLDTNNFYRAGRVDGTRRTDTWGTFICRKRIFDSISGFDEVFRGWGGEDDDIFRRLVAMGVNESEYPGEYVSPIRHDDLMRLAFYDIKERDIHHCINWFYIEAKMQLMAIHGRKEQPPLNVRQEIMQKIITSVLEWRDGKTDALPSVSFSIQKSSWLPSPYKMRKNINFTLAMEANSDSSIAT